MYVPWPRTQLYGVYRKYGTRRCQVYLAVIISDCSEGVRAIARTPSEQLHFIYDLTRVCTDAHLFLCPEHNKQILPLPQ